MLLLIGTGLFVGRDIWKQDEPSLDDSAISYHIKKIRKIRKSKEYFDSFIWDYTCRFKDYEVYNKFGKSERKSVLFWLSYYFKREK